MSNPAGPVIPLWPFSVLLAVLLVAAYVVGLTPFGLQSAQAAPGESCFTVSDGNNTLYRYNYDGPSYETLGPTGVPAIEAISWDPVNSVLYAMDAGQLGTLNQSTGAFTAIGPDSGLDMDGLAFDPFTGQLYGAIRRADGQSGGSGVYDDLALINPATGGVVVIGPISGPVDDTGDPLFDIDDLAFDPTDGSLWGVANAGGNDTLVTIDKSIGAVISSVGEFGANDMEGLSWNDIGGLRGTTGGGAQLWNVNPNTGAASGPINLSPGSDFESLGCYRLAGGINTITGTVFLDANVDSFLDGGDTGTSGHSVNLYRDVNGDGFLTNADDVSGNGVLDAADILDSMSSDGSGFYAFTVAASGRFIVQVDQSTLPAGSRLTTSDIRPIDFGTSYGQTDADNDFGYTIPAVTLTKTTSTPLIDSGDTAVYSYALANTGTEAFPVANITLTDNACAPVTGPTAGDTNSNNVLDPGETWTYACSTVLAQDTTNTGTATVVPAFGSNLVATDMAFVDVRPTMVVTKTEGVASIAEPGGSVTFTLTVQNTSAENVTINTISDSDFGDVLDGGNPLVTATTCVGGTVVLPGAGNTYSCTFAAAVAGTAAGPDHSNTVTVGASDDEGNTATDGDDATVVFTDVLPTVVVTKTPGVANIAELGGTVTFTIGVENTSVEPVDLTTLSDTDFGNLFTATNTTCTTTTIAIGATYTCSFDGVVSGTAAGPAHTNTATATVADDEGNSVSDDDDAVVAFNDVLPTIDVTKTANPTSVPAAGADVTFTVRVDNTSVEPVTLTALSDSIYGNVANALNPAITATTCSLPQAIGVAGFYQCTFNATVSGLPGGSELDVVTATANDDELNSAVDNDDATVAFAAGSIGDFVWLDLDGDGVQDGGPEVGLAGIDVGLYLDLDSSGTVTAGDVLVGTETTNGSGAYDFTGLAADDYVVVPDTAGALTTYALTGGVDPTAIALGADEDFNGADFGYQPTGSIGDFVWLDLDGDGVQDGGAEVGIAGVTVDLHLDVDGSGTVTAGDVLVGTETTNGSGAYDFVNVLPGDYVVAVTDTASAIPPSSLTGGSDPAAVSLTPGQDFNLADFGHQPFVTVGDRVWLDVNGDGIQDPGETAGVAGVSVNLVDPGLDLTPGTLDDVVVDTDVTDGAGDYLLTGPAGTYVVEFIGLPGGHIFSPADQGGDDALDSDVVPSTAFTSPQTLTGGQSDLTLDAGIFEPAQIGDRVFVDLDADGLFDAGEGIPNITVTLSDGQTTVTDSDGFYQFNAPAGAYTVTVDEVDPDFPANALQTVGTNPQPAVVTAGQTLDTVDFGYIIAGPGILLEKDPATQTVLVGSDVTFTITVTNIGNVDLSGVVVTDALVPACDLAAGNLLAGGTLSYNCVASAVASDFTNSATATGTPPVGPDVSSTDTASVDVVDPRITLTKDPATQTIVTGTTATFSITVTNTGDVDLTNVLVTDPLVPACDNPIGLLAVAGSVTYSCDAVAVAANFSNTATVTSDGPLGALPPVSDTADVIVDEATLAGRVWLDFDGDAAQDVGEPGADGVPVELLDGALAMVATTATDGNGDYSFVGLDADTYTVRVDRTALVVGSVPTADPDGTLDDETIQPVGLGDAIVGLDFGYQPPASVSGVVWNDADGDGSRDPGEPELGGIIVSGVCAGPDGVLGSGDDTVLPDQMTTGSFTFAQVPVSTCEFTVNPSSLPPGLATSTFDLDGGGDGTSIVVVPSGGRTDVDFGYQGTVDLLLTKASTEGNVQAGDEAEWVVTVTNIGASVAVGTITLTDDLPAGLNFISADGPGWTCTAAGSVLTCFHPGLLAVGESLEVRILTTVDEALSGTINNEAVVSYAGDFNLVNNTAVAGIGLLPNTGFNLNDALTWSLVSLLLGTGLIFATRRRDDDQDLVKNS